MTKNLRCMVTISMLVGVSWITMIILAIPILPTATFLKYEPSGAILLICGGLYGPIAGVTACLLKGLLHLFFGMGNIFGVSSDFLNNVCFLVPTIILLRKKAGVWSYVLGAIISTLVMIPANLIILQLEFGMSPDTILALMIPSILPFNLLKALCNSLIYAKIGTRIIKIHNCKYGHYMSRKE